MKIIYVVYINMGSELPTSDIPTSNKFSDLWGPGCWEAKCAYTTRRAAEKHIEWCLQEYGDRIEYCIEELELYK